MPAINPARPAVITRPDGSQIICQHVYTLPKGVYPNRAEITRFYGKIAKPEHSNRKWFDRYVFKTATGYIILTMNENNGSAGSAGNAAVRFPTVQNILGRKVA